jgi:integrase
MSVSSVNKHLPIRKLIEEAADNGALSPVVAESIRRVKGAKRQSVRLGNWLPQEDAQRLLDLTDSKTARGNRDRAILAVLLGGALRRREAAAVRLEPFQQREGH